MSEREGTVNIGRRQFIKGLLIGSGTMLAAGSMLDGYLNIGKHYQIYKAAERKVEAQGLTQANQEMQQLAKQMRNGQYNLSSRSLDEIVTDVKRVRATEAQPDNFMVAVNEVINEQRTHLPTNKRYVIDTVGFGVGATAVFGATVCLPNPKTVEAPRQNEVTLEEKT